MTTDWGGMLADAGAAAVQGAAEGSVMPGVGTAVGGLIGLASSLVPHIFGNDAKPALAAAAQVVTGVTDEAQQVAVLSSDPAAIAQFKVEALKIARDREQAQLDAQSSDIASRLADAQSARDTALALNAAKSPMAWGAAVVSVVLLSAWFASMIANYFGAPSLSADDSATLRNLAIGVAGFWLGSSAGSARKTDLLARSR